MSFFPREEHFRHQGKKMTVTTFDTERLLPEEDWEKHANNNARRMEEADQQLFNRILTKSDPPHKGKRTGEALGGYTKRENINLFLPYGTQPPPPAKPPNVFLHDEDYYRQFVHEGCAKHREEETQKIITAPSSFESMMTRNRSNHNDNFYNNAADKLANSPTPISKVDPKSPGRAGHGLLDDLVLKGAVGRAGGKKIDQSHISTGVLTRESDPIKGFAGLGSSEPHHHRTGKAATPTPTYDPLGLNHQKDIAKERVRATSTTPQRVKEYGMPQHIARKDLPCYASTLVRHEAEASLRTVPSEPASGKNFAYSPFKDLKLDHEVISGFKGIGGRCLDKGIPHQTGLKKLSPQHARSNPAPHRNLPLYQAHSEAYIGR